MPAQETCQQKPLQHIMYRAYNSHEPTPTPIIKEKECSDVLSEDCHMLDVVTMDKSFIMRASKVPLFKHCSKIGGSQELVEATIDWDSLNC